MNKIIIAVVIIAAAALGGYFLFGGLYKSPYTHETQNQQRLPPPTNQTPANEKNVIIYTNADYSPNTITIKAGETVIWKNQSSRSMWPASAMHPTHRVYSGTSLDEHCPDITNSDFDACTGMLPGNSWSFKFDKIGSWKYHDHLNPYSTGTVAVE